MTEKNNIESAAQILFEGHGHDARFNGPLSVSPTVSAAYGEGGGNIPLVLCPVSPQHSPTEIIKEGAAVWPMSMSPKTSRK